MHYELARELLSVTLQQQSRLRRRGLFEELEKSIKKHFYADREDAVKTALSRRPQQQKLPIATPSHP